MKIGILTSFWFTDDNYGSVLQSYALSVYLRKKGHDVFLIRYNLRNDIKVPISKKILKVLNLNKLINFFYNKIVNKIMGKENLKRDFLSFKNSNLAYSKKFYNSYTNLFKDPPNCDCYIVGSDQVWNFYNVPFKYTKNTVDSFFLNFGKNETKRIAFAASFGGTKIDKEIKDYANILLQNFNYISVREKSGLEILKNMNIAVDWILDPIFLIDVEQYKNLFTGNKRKKYIFVYLLSNKCNFSMKQLRKYALKNGLEIIYVTGNNKFDFFEKDYASIPDWLEYIYNAECVITNSFHCSAFSILFNVNFYIIPQVNSMNQNDRFSSLFDYFNLSCRYIYKNCFDIIKNDIAWNEINKKISDNKYLIDSKIEKVIN